MKNMLVYNDFIGFVDFSADDEVFFGKVEGIDDLVSFEGSSVSELKAAFESSIDDYIEFCKKNNKQPEKSYKRQFQCKNAAGDSYAGKTPCTYERNIVESICSTGC